MAEEWDELDRLPGPPWDLAPAAEIRRRGDARARRRHRARLLAGGLGVGVVAALPVVAVLGDRPAPRDPAWVHTVPSDFALDAGMETPTRTRRDGALRRTSICGETRWAEGAATEALDLLIATDTGTGTDEQRALLVYPTDTVARDALGELRRTAGRCTTTAAAPSGRGESEGEGEDEASESWAYVESPDADSVLVVRVGNAMLVTQTSGEREPAEVVRAMCVFRPDPC